MCNDKFDNPENVYCEDGIKTPESYEFNEHNAFRSMLNISRNQDRQKYICKGLNPPHIIIDSSSEEDECEESCGSYSSTVEKNYTKSLDYKRKGIQKTQRQYLFGNEDEQPVAAQEEEPCIQWDETEKPLEPVLNRKIESLVEDLYFPGFIDDAVNGKINFNQISFNMTFSEKNIPVDEPRPEETPISLIEAFDLRVQREQSKLEKALKTEPTHIPKNKKFIDYLQEIKIINREENLLANAVEIDVANVIKNQPMTELTRAISCLQRAEIMNDFDKSFQAAETAFENATSPETAESAAISKARTFKTEQILKKKINLPPEANYLPIEIVSYMGITKPIEPIDKCKAKTKFKK